MIISQLNHQIILLLKRPVTHYWMSPLKQESLGQLFPESNVSFKNYGISIAIKI